MRPLLKKVRVTRYVTPLREGGSLPAIVEADDLGLYVLKFRGAGQGARALVAELVCGELARALPPDKIDAIVAMIPDGWLADDGPAGEAARHRAAYGRYLRDRLARRRAFVEEAVRVR